MRIETRISKTRETAKQDGFGPYDTKRIKDWDTGRLRETRESKETWATGILTPSVFLSA